MSFFPTLQSHSSVTILVLIDLGHCPKPASNSKEGLWTHRDNFKTQSVSGLWPWIYHMISWFCSTTCLLESPDSILKGKVNCLTHGKFTTLKCVMDISRMTVMGPLPRFFVMVSVWAYMALQRKDEGNLDLGIPYREVSDQLTPPYSPTSARHVISESQTVYSYQCGLLISESENSSKALGNSLRCK